jgi:hypothetical protein
MASSIKSAKYELRKAIQATLKKLSQEEIAKQCL